MRPRGENLIENLISGGKALGIKISVITKVGCFRTCNNSIWHDKAKRDSNDTQAQNDPFDGPFYVGFELCNYENGNRRY